MRTKVMKWGNSYAIRLPKQCIEEMQLAENSELLIEQQGEQLRLKKPTKKARLIELLENVEKQKETDWGKPRGKEIW